MRNFFVKLILILFLFVIGDRSEIRVQKFEQPFCMIGNGNSKISFNKKLSILKKYQKNISRKNKSFIKNKNLEDKNKLIGSAKWLALKYLDHKNYTDDEKNFLFFALTLFGEARNLSEQSMEMVARVINNRKGDKSYIDTVSKLAQFSTWYYKHQHDNTVLLCPSLAQTKNWHKALRVAKKHFRRDDHILKSKYYFSPHNMLPKFSVPYWSKGKHVVTYGGQVFIVNKDTYRGKQQIYYIPKNIDSIKVRRGIILI